MHVVYLWMGVCVCVCVCVCVHEYAGLWVRPVRVVLPRLAFEYLSAVCILLGGSYRAWPTVILWRHI